MIKNLIKYKRTLFLLLILELIVAFVIFINTQHEIDTFINNKTKSAEIEYKAIYTKVKEQSEMIFQEIISTPIVINNFNKNDASNNKEKNIIRDELYNDLLPIYQRLQKLVHLKQVQFVFPNNKSFLRMHKPSKFGDDLTGIRATLEYANKFKKPIDGFEEGRVFNGFRFVYPLFNKLNKHLGSVEVSFSVESFNNVLDNEIHSSKLIILKSIVDAKVWKKSAKLNYQKTIISPLFLMDVSQFDKQDMNEIEQLKHKVTPQLKLAFSQKRLNEEAFSLSLPLKGTTCLLTFLPIKNPISDKVVAYIILSSQSNILNKINMRFWLLQSFSIILILTFFMFIYRNRKSNELLKKSESKYISVIENIKNHYFFYSHDVDGVFTNVSDSITDILGYTKKEFMEHYSTYLTDDPINSIVTEYTQKTINGEVQKPYTLSIYHKDGSVIYLEITESRYNNSDGEFIAVEGVARDITQNFLIGQKLNEKNSELVKSNKNLDVVFEASGEGIWDWNVITNHVEHNNTWYEILGLENNKDLIDDFTTLIHPEDKKDVLKRIGDTLSGYTQTYQSEHRLFKQNGETVWVVDKGRIVERDENGEPLRMAGSFSVITERKRVEAKLEEQHKYLQSIIDGVDDSIMVIKEDYTIEIMNKNLKKSLKSIKVADPNRPKCYELSHQRSTPCDGNAHPCPLKKVLATKKHTTVVHNHNTIDGDNRYIELSASPLFDIENNCIGIIESARDITEHLSVQYELREQKNVLSHQAHHDALTGLPNRVLFNDRLEQAIEVAKRGRTNVALLFIDLDHFKEINDSLGHAVGDEILKIVSKKLQEAIRDEDTVARLGGDEFTIILGELSRSQDASFIASKILESLAKPMVVNDNTLYVSSSIGISVYPEDGASAENLLKYADSAMYKAKDEGRNNFQYYNATMTELAFERVVMETSLRAALKNDEFIVYYQPQVDGTTNKLIGMEALVRWQHPTMGLVSPVKFIPLAETTGLIVELDRQVMKKAMSQVAKWYEEGLNPGVLAMNLAIKQLQQKDFISMFESLIKETGCKAQWIELEITEGQIITNPDKAIKLMTQISDLGIELAVDDFGTGYSSLAYLKRFPIDKLKIDQTFTRGLPNDEEDVGITRAVIALAKSLKLKVIAEGVETIEQKNFLVVNGCKNIQGYFYSKPVPHHEFKAFLENGF